MSRKLSLLVFLFCLSSALADDGWYLKCWTNGGNYFSGIPYSGTVARVSGSTFVDTNSTSWSDITTNYQRQLLRYYQPSNGLWAANYERTNISVKVALPLPHSTVVYTNSVVSNVVTRAAVSNQCTYLTETNTCFINSLSNVLIAVSITQSNWVFGGLSDTNTTIIFSSNQWVASAVSNPCQIYWGTNSVTNFCYAPAVSNLVVATNTLVKITIDRSTVGLVLTNITLDTNNYLVVACEADPLTAGAIPWVNGTNSLNYSLTNTPQLLEWDYTPIYNSTNDIDGGSNVIVSAFFPVTNWNINGLQIAVYDTTLAENNRDNAIGVSSNAWEQQAIPPLDSVQASAVQGAIQQKAYLLAHAGPWAITSMADDGHNDFSTWVASVRTSHVWQARNGTLWGSNPPAAYAGTNAWGITLSHRLPPTWGTTFYLDANTNLTTDPPYPFAQPVSMGVVFCKQLKLPIDYRTVVVTNTGLFDGWQVGLLFVHNTNTSQIVTQLVPVSSFFDWTPPDHDIGKGHMVTNPFTIRNAWLTWDSTTDVATNEANVVTNSLGISANTVLNLSVPYWSNGVASLSIVESNSAFYTRQITSFTNWTTVATNRFWGAYTVPSNCQSNLFTTNVISGGVTNTLTNIVLTCFYTNTATVALNVKRADWIGTNATVTGLLSVTLSNAVNLNSTNSVFPNYNVASGRHDGDYEYDGVRTGIVACAVLVVGTDAFWQGQDAWIASRYNPSNQVGASVNTNLMGYWTPSIVTSDTLAHAEGGQSFTNLPSGNPGGYTYAAKEPGTYFKDVWQASGYYATAAIGDDVYLQGGITATQVLYYCVDGSCPAAAGGGACGVGVPPYFGSCFTNETEAENFLVANGDTILPGLGVEGEVWFSFCLPSGFGPQSTNTVADCNLRDIVNDLTNCVTSYSSSNGTFSLSYQYGEKTFWHGRSPTDQDWCCSMNGTSYAAVVTWSLIHSNISDSSTMAYSSSGAPDPASVIGVTLIAQQESSAGYFPDVCLDYSSARVVYVPTVAPTGFGLNTNILPVRLTIGTVTVPVTNSLTPSTDCTNKFASMMPQPWYLGVDSQTWPTVTNTIYFYSHSISNRTDAITNAAWSTQGTWQAPTAMPAGSYDTTNRIGSYARLVLSPSPSSSNLVWQTDFLSSSWLTSYPSTPDGILRGWGLNGSVWLLLDYSMPYR